MGEFDERPDAVPLWEFLKGYENPEETDIPILAEVEFWAQARQKKADIAIVDPKLEPLCVKFLEIQASTLQRMQELQHEEALGIELEPKLQKAADAMKAQLTSKLQALQPGQDPSGTDVFKEKAGKIDEWHARKLEDHAKTCSSLQFSLKELEGKAIGSCGSFTGLLKSLWCLWTILTLT